MKCFLSKKMVCAIMLLSLVAGMVTLPSDVQAADVDAGQKVVYQEYKNKSEVKEKYFVPHEAPTYLAKKDTPDSYGYLFGGWFTKVKVGDTEKFKVIKDVQGLQDAANCYAKFVPAYVLSVKCQNMHNATVKIEQTNMRFVAGLDSINYASFGFKVCGVSVDNAGNVTKVSASKEYVPKDNKTWTSLFVYSGEQVKGEAPSGTKHTPKAVLGGVAKYFMTYGLKISNKNFDKIYSIQPFWKTFDGVTVYGLTKYAHVEDGVGRSGAFSHAVNIPINLKNSNAVAAGMVEFDWTDLHDNGYTFMGAECGSPFEILKTKVKEVNGKKIVQCLALVDIVGGTTEDKASDDIFINLRFVPDTTKTVTPKTYDGTFYHFGVNEEDFSNINEVKFAGENYDVWDIQY